MDRAKKGLTLLVISEIHIRTGVQDGHDVSCEDKETRRQDKLALLSISNMTDKTYPCTRIYYCDPDSPCLGE